MTRRYRFTLVEARASGAGRRAKKRSLVARVGKALRYRCSPQYAYLDLGRSSANTVFVTGTQRSGTTWIAELLNHDNRYRMIFEPLNKWRSPFAPQGYVWGQYLAPDDEAREWQPALAAVVNGHVRSPRSDRANRRYLARRRLVKCVNATNLLPWLHRWHPRMQTIHVLRHPFAAADSVCRLLERGGAESGWHRQVAAVDEVISHAGLLDGPLIHDRDTVLGLREQCRTPFTLFVLRWCLENVVPLRVLESSPMHRVVLYERVVLNHAFELDRLARYLDSPSIATVARTRRPSTTDFHRRVEATLARPGGEMELVGRWDSATSQPDLRVGMTILRAFELDHLYGLDPLPFDVALGR